METTPNPTKTLQQGGLVETLKEEDSMGSTKENPKMDMRLMACSISGVTSEAIQFQKVFDTSCVPDGDHPQQRLITPSSKDGFHFVLKGRVIPWIQM